MGVDIRKEIVIGGMVTISVSVEHHQRKLGDAPYAFLQVAWLRPGVQQHGARLPHNEKAANDLLLKCPHAGADFLDCGFLGIHETSLLWNQSLK